MVRKKADIEKIFLQGDQLRESFSGPVDIDWFVGKEATTHYPSNLKKVIDMILKS